MIAIAWTKLIHGQSGHQQSSDESGLGKVAAQIQEHLIKVAAERSAAGPEGASGSYPNLKRKDHTSSDGSVRNTKSARIDVTTATSTNPHIGHEGSARETEGTQEVLSPTWFSGPNWKPYPEAETIHIPEHRTLELASTSAAGRSDKKETKKLELEDYFGNQKNLDQWMVTRNTALEKAGALKERNDLATYIDGRDETFIKTIYDDDTLKMIRDLKSLEDSVYRSNTIALGEALLKVLTPETDCVQQMINFMGILDVEPAPGNSEFEYALLSLYRRFSAHFNEREMRLMLPVMKVAIQCTSPTQLNKIRAFMLPDEDFVKVYRDRIRDEGVIRMLGATVREMDIRQKMEDVWTPRQLQYQRTAYASGFLHKTLEILKIGIPENTIYQDIEMVQRLIATVSVLTHILNMKDQELKKTVDLVKEKITEALPILCPP